MVMINAMSSKSKSPITTSIKITKPKRCDNGTYEGQIYKNNRKELVQINVNDARIVSIKQHNNDYYLYIKHKSLAQTMYDINNDIISVVKSCCNSWFKNTLSDDLIEDYFTSNIIYDKDIGQVIKFKCLNDISELQKNILVNISFTLKYIRFYKQKFAIEWDVDEVEICDTVCFDEIKSDTSDHSDEDVPEPLIEELLSIKEEYINTIDNNIHRLMTEVEAINKKIKSLESLKDSLMDMSNFSKVADELDKIIWQ